MAHTISAKKVYTAAPIQNVDSSSNVETRGGVFYGEINISSYTSSGEIISAAEVGMNEIYNGIFMTSGSDTYAVRSFEVAAGNKSATLNVDTAGTGTEVTGTTAVGTVACIVWGELLGSGSN